MSNEPPQIDHIYVQQVLPSAGSRRLVSLLDMSLPTDTLELYVAMITCLWGVWIGLWDLASAWCCPWADLSEAANILNMTFTFMPQWAWGIIGASIGGLHLVTRLQHISIRRFWLMLDAMFWTAVTVTIAMHVPYSTGIVAYGGLAFAAGLSSLRLYIISSRVLATRGLQSEGR